MTYRPLPLEFNKNTYHYKQVWRDDDYAIYEQRDGSQLVAYEVYHIKLTKAGEMKVKEKIKGEETGNILTIQMEATESIPGSEQWGTSAYTVADMDRAFKRIEDMKAASAARLAAKN